MKIRLSRHAKRRAKLYKIPEEVISDVLKTAPNTPGKNEITKKLNNFQFPLKIIYFIEKDELIVITNYPLKKEKKT